MSTHAAAVPATAPLAALGLLGPALRQASMPNPNHPLAPQHHQIHTTHVAPGFGDGIAYTLRLVSFGLVFTTPPTRAHTRAHTHFLLPTHHLVQVVVVSVHGAVLALLVVQRRARVRAAAAGLHVGAVHQEGPRVHHQVVALVGQRADLGGGGVGKGVTVMINSGVNALGVGGWGCKVRTLGTGDKQGIQALGSRGQQVGRRSGGATRGGREVGDVRWEVGREG